MNRFLGLTACAVFAASARAQSINLDFGAAASAPPATYGAAGLQGVWNSIINMPSGQRFNLVALNGLPVAARIYQLGADFSLDDHDPAIEGDDALLMDDMIISHNAPVDACFWFEGLTLGTYEVTIYALTPNDPGLQHRVRVDFGSPGPLMVGGAWPGRHVLGLTFARHTVTTNNGVIGFHSGLYGGQIVSGINGVQIRKIGECAADWDHNNLVQPVDIAQFVNAWQSGLAAGSQLGDFNHDGVVTPADVAAFVTAWFAAASSGC